MISIKVLQLISNNDFGGGGNHILNICSAPKVKYDSFLCCVGKGILYDKAKEKGIECINLSVKEILQGKLIEYINKNKIDIINFHGAKANFLYIFLNKKIKIASVVTVHSDYRSDFMNNRIKYIFFTPLNKLGLKKFKFYICVSNYIKELLEQNNFIGDKFIVNNGTYTKSIEVLESKDDIRKKYNIGMQDFVFITVGRLHPVKNHSGIIEAFDKLRKEVKDIKLIFVGDGVLKEALKEKVREFNLQGEIIFTGWIDNVLDYIRAANISILASFSEGGAPPIAVLDSAMAKRSVICPKIGDMDEVIDKDNNMGYLMSENSVDELYKEMKKAYLNRDNMEVMGSNFYNHIVKNFSMEVFWNKYKSFYETILYKVSSKK